MSSAVKGLTDEIIKDARKATNSKTLSANQRLTANAEYIETLRQLRKKMEESGNTTMVPLLPYTFRLNGKPYDLTNYFAFEPMFKTARPNVITYKTARQVSKSTSIGAQGIISATTIPFYNILYVCPLSEQIRKFSHNYVKEFIERSPRRATWVNSDCVQQVLQRQFTNGSNLFFSFAFLDAERTRGIPAGENRVDESVRVGTMVETPTGPRRIEDFEPGDAIYSINEQGDYEEDTVKAASYHGVRRCYRLRFANGAVLDATSDSFIATEHGWRRVQSIIADAFANADASRDDAGRREFEEESEGCAIPLAARLEAKKVQLPKVPGITRVRKGPTVEAEERWLGEMVQRICNFGMCSLLPYRCFVSSKQQEAREYGVVGSAHVGRRGLVVHGRRFQDWVHSGVQHSGLFEGRSSIIDQVAERSWSKVLNGQSAIQAESRQDVLHHPRSRRRHTGVVQTASSLRFSRDGLQAGLLGKTRGAYLSLVQYHFPSIGSRAVRVCPQNDDEACTLPGVLPSSGVRGAGEQGKSKGRKGTPRSTGKAQRKTETVLRGKYRRSEKVQSRESQKITFGEPGSSTSRKAKTFSQEASRTTSTTLDLSGSLRENGSIRYPRSEDSLLSRLSCDRRSEVESGVRAEASALVSIEYVGKHHVYDLEVENNQTFIAGGVVVHNCQDVNYDLLQIIHETLSGSEYGYIGYTGTPKSLDNTMEKLWTDSSMAEWVTKCQTGGCGHWNIPRLDYDLIPMIGKWHDSISEKHPGVVCAKCQKPLNIRSGHFLHAIKDRKGVNEGYHVPQIIMPMHYANPVKWGRLLGKMQGKNNTTFTTFLNEVCGESYDEGSKILTETDLKNASVLPWSNNMDDAIEGHKKFRYVKKVVAVDWGGGGGKVKGAGKSKDGEEKRERTSFTVVTVLGVRPDGSIDVIWGTRSLRTHDYKYEAELIKLVLEKFHCHAVVHDYGGAGAVREIILHDAGINYEALEPVTYHGSRKNMVIEHEPSEEHDRHWTSFDKSKSLMFTMQAIKAKVVRFFRYDYVDSNDTGLIRDFLALIEEKTEGINTGDHYKIVRIPSKTDDFAQAVNLGCNTLWYRTIGAWPNLANEFAIRIAPYSSPASTPNPEMMEAEVADNE